MYVCIYANVTINTKAHIRTPHSKFCSGFFTLGPEKISTTGSLPLLWQFLSLFFFCLCVSVTKFYFPSLWAVLVSKRMFSVLRYGCPSYASCRFVSLLSRAESGTVASWASPPHAGSKATVYGNTVKIMLHKALRGTKELKQAGKSLQRDLRSACGVWSVVI